MFALASLATLALFLVSSTTVNALWPLAPSTRHLVMAGACALLLPLLALPCGAGGLLSRRPVLPAHQPARMDLGQADQLDANAAPSSSRASSSASFGSLKGKGELDLEEPLLEPPGQQLVAGVADEHELQAQALDSPPAAATPPPELAPLQCLCSLDFWLLFAVITIGTGSGAHVRALRRMRQYSHVLACASSSSQHMCAMCGAVAITPDISSPAGLALLNNLAQVVAATAGDGGTASTTAVLLSIFSVANCSGGCCLVLGRAGH